MFCWCVISVYLFYILHRWEQTEAAAAGTGAELDGGPAGGCCKRRSRPESAADSGPAGGEQSRPGEPPIGAAQPAGVQRARWGRGCIMTVFQPWLLQGKQTEYYCLFSKMSFLQTSLYSHLATLGTFTEAVGIKCPSDCGCSGRLSEFPSYGIFLIGSRIQPDHLEKILALNAQSGSHMNNVTGFAGCIHSSCVLALKDPILMYFKCKPWGTKTASFVICKMLSNFFLKTIWGFSRLS